MHKLTYVKYYNQLKDSLSNHQTGENEFAIANLTFIFDRDNEGFLEENTITVVDMLAKRTLNFYFLNENYCGVSLKPFLHMVGCEAMVPDIVGEINLEQTFEKTLKYVNEHKNGFYLYFFENYSYMGVEQNTEQFLIEYFNPTDIKYIDLLKTVFENQLEIDDFELLFNEKEYSFPAGSNPFKALNITKKEFHKNDNNQIFYPSIFIKFTNYNDMTNKFIKINQKIKEMKEKKNA